MTESYDADALTIRALLKDSPLVVPPFQRAYSWKPAQVKEFWEDLTDFADGKPRKKDRYFLGAIVLVEKQRSSEVLDGQQRLATATMVLAAVRDLLAAAGGSSATEAKELQEDYIVGKEFRKRRSFRLDLSTQDREVFRRWIQEGKAGTPVPDRFEFESHKLINTAYGAIVKGAADYRGTDDEGLQKVAKLAEVLLDNVSVARCSSTDYVTAATVFETLNSRGKPLSTSELIRSWTMSRAKNQSERDQISDSWDEILSIHEDANVDDFIRHYWIAKHGDVKGGRLYKFIREHKDMRRKSPVAFSRDLEYASAIYGDLAGAKTRDAKTDRSLSAISAIGAKALYPALLNIWQKQAADRKVRRDFTSMLLRLYVRHILIGGRDNSQLEQTVFGIAKYVRTMELSQALRLAKVDVREIAPDDRNFVKDFSEASIASTASATYVLRELEGSRRPRGELTVADADQVHVEHIYPRNPPQSRRWSDHDKVVNRIGNLTPLSAPINRKLTNGTFPKKKPEYRGSELLITKDLARRRAWSTKAIEERQAQLAKAAPKIWPLP